MQGIKDLAPDVLAEAIWNVAGYTPSAQQRAIHEDNSLVKLVAGGIRSGKSTFAAREAAKYLFIEDGLIWIIGPDYAQSRAEFYYMYNPLKQLDMIASESLPSQGPVTFKTKWGCKVETKSTSHDVAQIASFAPDFLLMVEAGQQPYEVFESSTERALEKNSPIVMSGTFERSYYWYGDKWREWGRPNVMQAKSFSLPSYSNLAAFPLGEEDPGIIRLRNTLSKERFQERVAAIPHRSDGLVFPEFDSERHTGPLEYQAGSPVELAIDPGWLGGYSVLFIQKLGQLVNVLDEVYVRETIGSDVIKLCEDRPYWKYATSGVIDIAGKQHHGNESQVEVWETYAGHIDLRWNSGVDPLDAIEVVKVRLKEDEALDRPYLMINETLDSSKTVTGRAMGLLGEFDLYRWRPWREGANVVKRPVKANDHAINALGYYLYDCEGINLEYGAIQPAVQRGHWELPKTRSMLVHRGAGPKRKYWS